MSITLKHSAADVDIEEIAGGKRRISVFPAQKSLYLSVKSCATSYPVWLIQLILDTKGPLSLCDEIKRDEDPYYVRLCLEKDLFAYVAPEDFAGKTVLDFGCGAGASTMILARLLPGCQITAVDLSENLLTIARARARHYGFSNIDFICSPAGDELVAGIGPVDFIILSAVFEHLLPHERRRLLVELWDLLKSPGVLFLDQTPHRYFIFEGHTTHLPFINYLPDRWALTYARRFSPRVGTDETWTSLLRRGIRGATAGELLKIIKSSGRAEPTFLPPHRSGLNDQIDLWYAAHAVAINHKYPWAKPVQRFLRVFFKIIKITTGLVLVPSLALALKKDPCSKQGPEPSLRW